MNLKHLDYMDDLFNSEIKRGSLKGCSFAIFDGNKKIMEKSYGSDSLNTVYKIYSMSKPIISVGALMLYEQGKIDLFEPVYNYFPAYKDIKVAKGIGMDETLTDPKRPILIKDLFNMTSGLVYPGEWSYAEKCMEDIKNDLHTRAVNGEKLSSFDIISAWAKAPLRCDPGEGWIYGTSADVIGGIIEIVSNMSLGEYLKKYIFEPLNMKDTGFKVDPKNKDRLAKMYYFDDDSHILREASKKELEWLNEYAPFEDPYFESGGGGLYSTLKDYGHFTRMLVNEGEYKGHRLLSPSTIKFLSSNQLSDDVTKTIYFEDLMGYGYGNLCRQLIDPAAAGSNSPKGEYGWDGLAGTYFFVDPVNKLSYVYMQQIAQGGDKTLRRKMKQIIYGGLY